MIRVQRDTSDASVRLAGATDGRPQFANVTVAWRRSGISDTSGLSRRLLNVVPDQAVADEQ